MTTALQHDAPTEALTGRMFLLHSITAVEEQLHKALQALWRADQLVECSEEWQHGLELHLSREEVGNLSDTIIVILERLQTVRAA